MRTKRLIAIITVLMLIFTQILSIQGFAQEETSPYTESELASFNSKLDMLLSLKVIENVKKDPEENLTRAEFAGLVADIMGSSLHEASFSENTYIDVKELTPNAVDIVALRNMGIMVGVNSVEFRPDDTVTYAQAIKVIVTALGYRELAELNGGYYTGYLKKAIDLKLLKGGASDYNRALTWYDAVLLFEASLEAPIPEIDSVGDDSITYSNQKSRNLLSVYHNIYKHEGIMTDNGQTALSGESQASLNNTVIGGVLMTNIPEKFTDLLGQSVVSYYYEGDFREFRYAYAKEARNDIITINAYDLDVNNSQFNKKAVCYKNAAGKSVKAQLDPYADFIYNGSAYPEFLSKDLKIETGTLTLIDADSDKLYETVIAETFTDVLVSSVNYASGTIYSSYAEPVIYTEYDVVHFYNSDGKEIPVEDIKVNSLLTVYKSKDNTKLIAYLSTNYSEMVIDSVTVEEDGVTYISIGGETYRIGVFYANQMKSNASILKTPITGAKYKIFFNTANEAAMFLEVQAREEYAYLLAIGEETKYPDTGKISVKIVNEQGECIVVKSAKKYTLIDSSGTYENDNNAVLNSADIRNSSGELIPQLIRLKINNKGEFTKIEFDNTIPVAGEQAHKYGFDPSRFCCIDKSSVTVYGGFIKTFNGKSNIDSTTKIFIVEQIDDLVTTDETRVKVVPYSDFKFTGVKMAVYDTDQNWIAGAVVCSQRDSAYDDRTITVIDSKVVIDEFGEERVQVEGFWRDVKWTFREHHAGVFKAALEEKGFDGMPKRGDMFLLNFDNARAEITKARLIASPQRDLSDKRESLTSLDYVLSTHSYMVGTPVTATDSTIGIMANDKYEVMVISTSTWPIVYDMRTGEITRVEETQLPTIGYVDAYGNIDKGDESIKIVAYRERYFIKDALIVIR